MLSKNELLAAPAKPLIQSRNIRFDRKFYDTGSLSAQEEEQIFGFSDQEGAIVVVPPRGAPRPIRHYDDTTAMLRAEKGAIGGVAIAGVGSSILGTSALSRNVADAYGFDIAGIIAGYGATDLLAEAMGGWFFYGYMDRFRHSLEIMVENAANSFFAPWIRFAGAGLNDFNDLRSSTIPRELDSGTLLDILRAEPANLAVVVGHSKGALTVDFVLEEFVRQRGERAHRYYDELQVVTVSAVVGVPHRFKRVCQLMGSRDWLGKLNSLPDLLSDPNPATRPKFIEGVEHCLDTASASCMNLVDALRTHVPLEQMAPALPSRAPQLEWRT
jgi:hypothetical protein